jgi:hypothetical protein
MSNPGKYLNLENIIRKVFDHTTDSLRMSNSGAPVGIIISSSDDSIAIGNVAGDLLTINPDGSLNSNINGVTPVLGRIPVDIGGATVNITGPVNITNEVEIKNDAGSPIPINGTVTVTGVSTLAEQQSQTTKLNTIDSSLVNIDTNTLDIYSETQTHTGILNSIDSKLTSPLSITGSTVALDATTLAALENTNVTISNASIAVTGPLTDTQLRASAVPVSVSGVSTLAEQQTQTTSLQSIDTQVGSLLTELQLKADLTETQPVSLASIPLPTGAATSANQVTTNSSLSSIDTKLNNLDIRDLVFATDKVDATGSIVGLDATSLAALENITATVSGDINLSTSTLAALENVSIDNFPASQAVTGSFLTDAQLRASAVPVSGSVSVTGVATAANQATEIASLNSIDTKTPALGQALAAASTPVVLTAAQVSTLTPLSTVTANIGTTNGLALDTSVNTLLKPASTLSAVTTLGSITNTVVIKADTLVNQTNALKVDGSAVTQPISGNVGITGTPNVNVTNASLAITAASLPLPASASTSALQTTGNSSLSSIDSKIPTGLTVTTGRLQVELPSGSGGLTDAELRATPVAVSLSGVSTLLEQQSQTTLLTSIDTEVQSINASLDTQLSNVATEATLAALDTKITTTNVKLDSLLTELQLKADLSETQPVSVSGVATSALQTAGNASLSSIDTKLTSPLTTDLSASTLAALENISVNNFPVNQNVTVTSTVGLTDVELRASDISTIAKNELYASFSPDPSNISTGTFFAPAMDARGRVETHSTVLTDEGSFRDDFIGASLTSTITGTASFINGSTQLLGVGTLFSTEIKAGQYLKKTTDSETLYVKVSAIISDTEVELVSAYTGTTATSALHVSNWITSTGTGSISIVNSEMVVGSGTAINTTIIERTADYGPLNLAFKATISQRIANQTIILGLRDNVASPVFRAEFVFTGTNSSSITCISSSGTTANDVQTTIITLPNGVSTIMSNRYQVFLSNDRVSFLINGVVEAEHFDHIPGNYDILQMCSIVQNTAVVTNTNINTDWAALYNINQVEVQNSFGAKPLFVETTDANANAEISAVSQVAALDVTEKSSVVFNIQGTWVGTLALQASTDNVNWTSLNGIYDITGQVVSDATTNGAIVCPVGGYKYCRITSTTWTSGSAQININASTGVNTVQPFNTINAPLYISNVGQTRRVYSAANTAFTAANLATDFFTITGSATRIVRVLRIGFSATQTVLSNVNIQLLKRSTANTGGTSTLRTAVPSDSLQIAATAEVRTYTANPTQGTLVGVMKATRVTIPAPASAVVNEERLYDFTDRPIVLRGINEVLALNLNGVTVTGNIFSCFIEFTEE